MMDEAGTLPSHPERRWSLGSGSPVVEPLHELPPALSGRLKACSAELTEALPSDYGDAEGLWLTVRRHNPFDVLLLTDRDQATPEIVLARFRLLWKFWTQKRTLARQGATRAVIQQKYGDQLDSYLDSLQWAHDQLTATDGVAFWRKRLDEQRLQEAWNRISESVEATLADGLLEPAETAHLFRRAEAVGYEREEFARVLRDALHARRIEPEVAPSGDSESARLLSVRWASTEVWRRIKSTALEAPVQRYYVRLQRTGQVIGPVNGQQVRELVRARHAGAEDAVCVVGATHWRSLRHTEFGFALPDALPQSRLCPRCGEALVSVVKPPTTGWVMFLLGVPLLAVGIGVVLMIAGAVMIWGTSSQTLMWRCMRCTHRA